jgi:hypothetical protein
MGVRLNAVTLLVSIAVFGCGGKSRGEAKSAETDPWAGYKGTYATAAGASGSPSTRMKSAKIEVAQTEAPKEASLDLSDKTPAQASTSLSPAKKGKAAPVKSGAKKKKPQN